MATVHEKLELHALSNKFIFRTLKHSYKSKYIREANRFSSIRPAETTKYV